MSYGDLLARAAAGLAQAHVALRDPPAPPEVRAGVALFRLRLYRSLERQVVAVGNVHARALPRPASRRYRCVRRSPAAAR